MLLSSGAMALSSIALVGAYCLCCFSTAPEISFGDEGLLTIEGSLGYKKNKELKRGENWCHLFIKNGIFEILW